MKTVFTYGENETTQQGKVFASGLKQGDVVACYGDLGSGKTRFIQGICDGLGVHEHVVSPTFTILNMYESGKGQICHFDLYRVNSLNELKELGFEEYTNGMYISLIEWAEKAEVLLPEEHYEVHFRLGNNENEREISISQPSGVEA